MDLYIILDSDCLHYRFVSAKKDTVTFSFSSLSFICNILFILENQRGKMHSCCLKIPHSTKKNGYILLYNITVGNTSSLALLKSILVLPLIQYHVYLKKISPHIQILLACQIHAQYFCVLLLLIRFKLNFIMITLATVNALQHPL